MLDRRFAFLAGTGRTGTHWIARLINRYTTAGEAHALHDGLPKRLKIRGMPSATLSNYFLNVMVSKPNARVYVECNPAFLEWVALAHRIDGARNVIPIGMLTYPAKAVHVVRHPFGYVKSLKARGWGWDWWKLPGFKFAQWNNLGQFEKSCYAWAVKTAFVSKLEGNGLTIAVTFESFLQCGPDEAMRTIDEIMRHLGIALAADDKTIKSQLGNRIAKKGGYLEKLTIAEKDTCRAICKRGMERYGYV